MAKRLFFLLLLPGCFGGGGPGDAFYPWDVRGNYALSYDQQIAVDLVSGGVVRHKLVAPDGVIDFGSFDGVSFHKLDAGAFCARPGVACPGEPLGPRVSIDQLEVEQDLPQHVIDVVGISGVHYRGVVDHKRQEEFLLGLGSFTSACAAPAPPPVVIGRFTHRGQTVVVEPGWRTAEDAGCTPSPLDGGNTDCSLNEVNGGVLWPADAPVDGITGGRISTTWLASCGISDLPADATITLSTGFVASRTGDYRPPSPPDLSAVEFDAAVEDASTTD